MNTDLMGAIDRSVVRRRRYAIPELNLATVSQVGTTTQCTTSGVLVVPTAAVNGNGLLAWLSCEDSSGMTLTTPTGWTFLGVENHTGGPDDDIITFLFVCINYQAGTTGLNFMPVGAAFAVDVFCAAFTGNNLAAPVDTGAGAPTFNGGASATPTATGLTPTTTGGLLFVFFACDDSGSQPTTPVGWTNAGRFTSIQFGFYGLSTLASTGGAPTGTVSSTQAANTDFTGILVSIVPAASGQPTSVIFDSMNF